MWTVVKNFEELVAGTALVLMVSLVILNVLLRYIFSYSIFWTEEVCTIAFVWAVFLGASAVYKHRMDIGIDLLVTKTPPKVQEWIKSAVLLLLLLINGYLFYMAVSYIQVSYIKPTAVLGVSSAVVSSALAVSFGLITWHTLRFIAQDIRAQLQTHQKV